MYVTCELYLFCVQNEISVLLSYNHANHAGIPSLNIKDNIIKEVNNYCFDLVGAEPPWVKLQILEITEDNVRDNIIRFGARLPQQLTRNPYYEWVDVNKKSLEGLLPIFYRIKP